MRKISDSLEKNKRLFCLSVLVQTDRELSLNPPELRQDLHHVKSIRVRSFSGPFRLSTEIYSVNFRTQTKCAKIRTRKLQIWTHFTQYYQGAFVCFFNDSYCSWIKLTYADLPSYPHLAGFSRIFLALPHPTRIFEICLLSRIFWNML